MEETTQKNVGTTVVLNTREYKFLKLVSVKKVDAEGKEHYYNNIYINNILVNAYDKRKQNDLAIFVKTFIEYNKD